MSNLLEDLDKILKELTEELNSERTEKGKRKIWKKIDEALEKRFQLTNPAS